MKIKLIVNSIVCCSVMTFIGCSVGSNLSISDSQATHSDYAGVSFGTVAIGNNIEKTLNVRNITHSTVEKIRQGAVLPEGFEFRGGQYPGTGGTCGEELANGDQCTIVVDFRPTSEKTSEGILELHSNEKWSPKYPTQVAKTSFSSIAIRGTGQR